MTSSMDEVRWVRSSRRLLRLLRSSSRVRSALLAESRISVRFSFRVLNRLLIVGIGYKLRLAWLRGRLGSESLSAD
jgi:hypothetical protein